MLNFGTDDMHMLYDASNNVHRCAMYQVWDPWSEVCRDVYCAADDVVFRCKSDKNNVTK